MSPPIRTEYITKLYNKMGKDKIGLMIYDFYHLLVKSEISYMFPKNDIGLSKSIEKSSCFFIQLFGGPQDYTNKYGIPRMKLYHKNFKIDQNIRDIWFNVFRNNLTKNYINYSVSYDDVDKILKYIDTFASWMMNVKSQ